MHLTVKNACWAVYLSGKFGCFSYNIYPYIYKFNFFFVVFCTVLGRFYFRKLIERWFWRCNKFNMFPRFLIIVFQSFSFSLASPALLPSVCVGKKYIYERTTGGKLNTWTLNKSEYGMRMLVIVASTENCIYLSIFLSHSFTFSYSVCFPLSLFFGEFSFVLYSRLPVND